MDHASVLPTIMAYHLLEVMTNYFSEDRELGRGTFGEVYMVCLILFPVTVLYT